MRIRLVSSAGALRAPARTRLGPRPLAGLEKLPLARREPLRGGTAAGCPGIVPGPRRGRSRGSVFHPHQARCGGGAGNGRVLRRRPSCLLRVAVVRAAPRRGRRGDRRMDCAGPVGFPDRSSDGPGRSPRACRMRWNCWWCASKPDCPSRTGFSVSPVKLKESQPALSDELALTWAEVNILPDRTQALANLAVRINNASVRSVVGVLSQGLRYGTPLAQALRAGVVEMRNRPDDGAR